MAADTLVFLLLGRYLIDRMVIRPLTAVATAADGIAKGDYERRVPLGASREIDALAGSLNQLTDQLLQNQERLAENVRSLDETNRVLIQTQRELVQAEKLASIGRLAAGVAHEVGNPLGALMGYASVLRRRGVDPELLGGIDREAQRIDRIVRSLLEYARPTSVAREPTDVNDSIRRVVAILHDQGRLGRLELVTDLEDALPTVNAVPHQLDQVFVNLFTNAEAAMEGVGRLTVVTRYERYHPDRPVPARRADDPPGVNYSHLRRPRSASERDARLLEEGDEIVKVIVQDSGPGIPEENIDAVFDPFFTTKAPGEGTGLGLAIVASTITDLGGRIEVASAEERGAIFAVSIPIGGEDG